MFLAARQEPANRHTARAPHSERGAARILSRRAAPRQHKSRMALVPCQQGAAAPHSPRAFKRTRTPARAGTSPPGRGRPGNLTGASPRAPGG